MEREGTLVFTGEPSPAWKVNSVHSAGFCISLFHLLWLRFRHAAQLRPNGTDIRPETNPSITKQLILRCFLPSITSSEEQKVKPEKHSELRFSFLCIFYSLCLCTINMKLFCRGNYLCSN